MPRLHHAIATGLAVMLIASCTRSGVDEAPASASNDAPSAVSEIVVTGSKTAAPGAVAQRRADVAQFSAAPPPPMPPRPIVVEPRMVAPQVFSARNAEPRPFPPPYRDVGRDRFTATAENPFKLVREEPVSTFSIDVDTASYAFVRASLNQNTLPQPAAVRTEEMVNYFPYDYAAPRSAGQPFSTSVAVFPSPWSPGRKLVRIGVRGYAIQRATRPRANLVFLIDTSGSMYAPNKLPLVKQSLAMLVEQLDANDSVAIVTYAGTAGTALAPTPASEKSRILAVIEGLGAGGSTAGAEGIRQAYKLAEENLDPHGVNRVILATDGDFNVGITDQGELKGYIERERGKGVFLSVLGFGMGNYNDALMQALAQNGNGAAAYIDTVSEARKTLVDEATSTLFPIAKDVKIQVEFNPATVSEYRLIGYETRMLNRDDFDNDKVDAGDVGSGQTVTALYEVVPVGGPRAIGDLRYARPAPDAQPRFANGTELGFVKIRYKLPKSETSRLISTPIDRLSEVRRFEDAPRDARFATGVAAFAELLRGGRYSGSMTYDDVLKIATASRGEDDFGYRSEFIQLVRAAKSAGSMARLER
jgi:Ca-activated chloride channel family protein